MAMIINLNFLTKQPALLIILSIFKPIIRKNGDKTLLKIYQQLQSHAIVCPGSIGINTFYKNSAAFSSKHRNQFP